MQTLDQLQEKSNQLWHEDKFVIPSIPINTQDYIQAYRDLNLNKHANELYFHARCQQAISMGFSFLTPFEIAKMLICKPNAKIIKVDRYESYEQNWFYDHLFDKCYDQTTAKFSQLPLMSYETNKWFNREKICMVPINMLKCAIPYGVLLRIMELKKLKLFNCFYAFAPEQVIRTEMYIKPASVDPVIVATMSNGHHINHNTVYINRHELAHFFVAKW
jgi:hypothetical protein